MQSILAILIPATLFLFVLWLNSKEATVEEAREQVDSL